MILRDKSFQILKKFYLGETKLYTDTKCKKERNNFKIVFFNRIEIEICC
jgi:hypothetical protein